MDTGIQLHNDARIWKVPLNIDSIQSNTCSFVGNGKSSLTSLDKNATQVAKSRLYVASLILKWTQTSRVSKPRLSRIKTEKVDQQLLNQQTVYEQVASLFHLSL